jgi:hypothetical protein
MLTSLLSTATHGGSYPAGGYGRDDDDLRGAAEHADRYAGSSGDSSFFSGLLGALGEKKGRLAQEDVDEDGKLGGPPIAIASFVSSGVLAPRIVTDVAFVTQMPSDSTRASSAMAAMATTRQMTVAWAQPLPCKP